MSLVRLEFRKFIALSNDDLESARSLDTMVSSQFVLGNFTGPAAAA
jgi:hypothetical protein